MNYKQYLMAQTGLQQYKIHDEILYEIFHEISLYRQECEYYRTSNSSRFTAVQKVQKYSCYSSVFSLLCLTLPDIAYFGMVFRSVS